MVGTEEGLASGRVLDNKVHYRICLLEGGKGREVQNIDASLLILLHSLHA